MRNFKKVYIEITNRCNLSCDFCPKTKRTQAFMDTALFMRILSEVSGHCKFIYFHVLGEPLLHPDLGTFLDIAADFGMRVNITTNGTLIHRVGDLLLSKPALRQVNFSLHSFEANEPGMGPDSYLDNLFQFIGEAQSQTALQICLRLWNLSEESKSEGNQAILRRIEAFFSLDYTLDEKLTPCSGIKVSKNVFLNQAQRFQWPNPDLPEIAGHQGFCYGLRDQIAILADGTLVPCCLDGEGTIALGNIQSQPLEDILDSSRAREMYNGFSSRKAVEYLCRTCGYRTRFNE